MATSSCIKITEKHTKHFYIRNEFEEMQKLLQLKSRTKNLSQNLPTQEICGKQNEEKSKFISFKHNKFFKHNARHKLA